MPATGTCQNCGDKFMHFVKTRKYCAACQILRDMDFAPKLKRKCGTCGKEFFPVRTNYKECPHCRPGLDNPIRFQTKCEICEGHKRLAPHSDRVCISCVQSDARTRARYVAGLRLKVQARIHENSVVS